MIKLLIVEDSALMRKHLKAIFSEDRGFDVRTARNGEDALSEIKQWDPDVVTLDINMPVMDGITCLSHIMSDSPRPVVMVSSLTEEGARITFEALELGAVDYIAKPGGTISLNIGVIEQQLLAKVKAAAKAKLKRARGLTARLRQQRLSAEELANRQKVQRLAKATKRQPSLRGVETGLVLIGVSTGGPSTLESIIPLLPDDYPVPILVAQHMPSSFTQIFAQRMNGLSALEVVEVSRPTLIEPGRVYIAKGDADMVVAPRPSGLHVMSVPSDKSLWHPSVNRMVESALNHLDPKELVGVLLTGMGDDGASQMSRIRQGGGRTIAESEATAVVYGMPKALADLGGANLILDADHIAQQLLEWS